MAVDFRKSVFFTMLIKWKYLMFIVFIQEIKVFTITILYTSQKYFTTEGETGESVIYCLFLKQHIYIEKGVPHRVYGSCRIERYSDKRVKEYIHDEGEKLGKCTLACIGEKLGKCTLACIGKYEG